MKPIFTPINLKTRKRLILKTLATIKKEYKYKENKIYLNNKIYKKSSSTFFKINHILIGEELKIYLKMNFINETKVPKNFIEKIMDLNSSLVNTKTIQLILLSYLAIETLKREVIYEEEQKQINRNFSLENLANEFENIYLTDYQEKTINEKYKINANVLSLFKKMIAYHYHIYFEFSKEESENIVRDLSFSLYDDNRKANFTREYFREKEFMVPMYIGKYISFL
jgi:hypothetical protein